MHLRELSSRTSTNSDGKMEEKKQKNLISLSATFSPSLFHLSLSSTVSILSFFPPLSVTLAAAGGPRTRVGYVVLLEAGVGRALPLTLTLRGEESILETHAGGCGLHTHTHQMIDRVPILIELDRYID